MDRHINGKYKIVLLSDAIFGAGYSIPGGVDMAVYKDGRGFPYFKGTSMKGLLRESMEQLLQWMGQERLALSEIFGEEGWNGAAVERRLHLSNAVLSGDVITPENCFSERTFTAMENGVTKDGSLRMCECICKGLSFEGNFECSRNDFDLIRDAFLNIKWIGTMRHKGFGHVKISCTGVEETTHLSAEIHNASYLRYLVRTESPIIMTDFSRSSGNMYETLDYISGSSMRGMIAGILSENDSEWFLKNKEKILYETIFTNAFPKSGNLPVIPAIKGFYEKKDGTEFQTILKDGNLTQGVKRASLGTFCAIRENVIEYWSAKTDGATRIKCKENTTDNTEMFQNRYLEEGQLFEGYIRCADNNISTKISKLIPKVVWLGADRFAGFGKCVIEVLEAVDEPSYFSYTNKKENGRDGKAYLLLLSPTAMLKENGENCGLDIAKLEKLLNVSNLQIDLCSTSVSEYGGYNRTWSSRLPRQRMYDAGSIFKLSFEGELNENTVLQLQKSGIGIRTEEGFGQILFLDNKLFEAITEKKTIEQDCDMYQLDGSKIRRASLKWIMEQEHNNWKGNLSNSQVGILQELCEKAKRENDAEVVRQYLAKNRNKTADVRDRYKDFDNFFEEMMQKDLNTIIGCGGKGSLIEKLNLISALMDYSRKGW